MATSLFVIIPLRGFFQFLYGENHICESRVEFHVEAKFSDCTMGIVGVPRKNAIIYLFCPFRKREGGFKTQPQFK